MNVRRLRERGEFVTVWDLMGAARRQWWVVVVVLLGIAYGARAAMSIPGIYSSRIEVDLALPITDANPNPLQFTNASLISLAGIVAQRVDVPGRVESETAKSVSLAGQRVARGYSVVLPNTGGQWSPDFERATLDVQAVGASQLEVATLMDRVIVAIGSELTALQDEQQVSPEFRATLLTPSIRPAVQYMDGSHVRSLAAVLLLGLGAGVALVVTVDSVTEWGSRRRAEAHSRVG